MKIKRKSFASGVRSWFGGATSLGVLLALQPAAPGLALTNNLALTPPMGWNSWNYFGCNVSDTLIRGIADTMATNGMQAAGYQFINIDDCWQVSRDTNGVIVPDPARFPNGIKALADYVHAKGFKLGIYSDHGLETCQGRPGGYGYEYLDANTYAAWGVDYLKYDNCNLPAGDDSRADYLRMADALMKSGRPITFSLCHWAYASWEPDAGNLWRTTGDINDSFASMVSNLNGNQPPAFLAGPGRWNDPDMLEVGNGGMTSTEDQAHFSLWCVVSAPLIAGNDLTSMSAQTASILTNAELIAVDQDPAGEQGIPAAGTTLQVWCKPLGTDFTTKAVALFNSTNAAQSITVTWTNVGLQAGPATVRDLWAHADLGIFTNSFTTNVPSHGAVLLRVAGIAPNAPASGTNYLSDLQPVYAYTSWGSLIADKSIAGNTITLNGTTYAKGLGANAYAGFEYRLGGVAARFQSDLGVDDDVGGNGSVVFQVFADGVKIYDSGRMTGGAPHQSIDLDVTGVNRLTLGANDADDGNGYDHADWAGARVLVSNTVPAAPLAPTGLVAGQGKPVVLSWNATTGANTYLIQRSGSSSGPFTNLASTAALEYADSDVTIGATYYYEISAVGKFGESASSAVASAQACSAPPAPSVLVVNLSGSAAGLVWNAVPGASGYMVERAVSSMPFSPVGFTVGASFTDSNLASGTIYRYEVISTNGCSQGPASGYVFAALPPAAPTGLSATPADSSIALSWNAPTGASGYNVKRAGTASGSYFTIGTNIPNAVYVDTSLTVGATYFYEVSALNSGGESSNSAYASATVCGGALPAGWADQDIGSVGFSGSASSCNGNSFVVQGGGADIWNSADAFNFAGDGFSGNASLAARVVDVEAIDPWTKAGLMFRNDTTTGSAFVDLFATPGNGVNMQWRSSSGGQCSSSSSANVLAPVWLKLVRSGATFIGYYSTNGTAWTSLGNASVTMTSLLGGLEVCAHNVSYLATATFDHVCTNVAAAPSGLAAAAGNGQVALTWTADPAAIGYNVKTSAIFGGPYSLVAANVPSAAYTVMGLANGRPDFFVVSTVNPLGESSNSPQVMATPSLPAAPTLNVSPASTNVVLTWQPAGGRLQVTPALGGTNTWADVSNGQPVSVPAAGTSNAFFRVVVP
jgi:alpha-galactosidase